MRQQTIRLRRAGCLLLYWRDRQLFLHNFARRLTASGSPVTCGVLDFFGEWRSPDEAIAHFASYSPRSVRSAISELIKHGLLLRKDSREAVQDSRIAKEWSDWLPEGSFHFSTKDVPYVDRSGWSLKRLKAIMPKTPQPGFIKTVGGTAKVSLPACPSSDSEFVRVLMARKTYRRFSNKELKLETVSELLSLVWGVTGYLYSPRFGKLLHKTSPSGGARHPGEVYLMALRVNGLRTGLYHYQPATHQLEMISSSASREKAWRYCAGQHFVRNAAALFLMTAVFPRTMWKYQHARAYRVVLLDAGHLCQTFCLVATWLGLAPFCTAALKDTLIEHDLGIDGIRESVLYVAGVGLPVTSARARQAAST
jgi:SagB-type dehydrogenase family enzyme